MSINFYQMNLRPILLSILLLFVLNSLSAQSFLQKIDPQGKDAYQTLNSLMPFSFSSAIDAESPDWGEAIEYGWLLELDQRSNRYLLEAPPERLRMDLPIPDGEPLQLLLKKVNIFQSETRVFAASDPEYQLEDFEAAFYWGAVEGFDNSMVSISIFQNEWIGFVYADGVEYSLARMHNDDRHLIYRNDDLKVYNQATCFFDENVHSVGDPVRLRSADPTNCVNVYVEANHDIYLQKGSVQAAAAYVLGAFSQVGILFANENIEFNVSELLVWDEPSPYSGPGAGQYLTQFRNHLAGNYNGDIAHLVGFGGGGGVAYLNTLCNSYWSVAYSGIAANYNDVPIYSWTVMVIAHEIGHNLGSRHTHACVWNGNNSAIDGCGPEAGYSEGCDAPLPSAGTIMSYCHLIGGVGIDFSLGFGPQPGDLIRDNVYNASCLGECETIENDAGVAGFLKPSSLECQSTFTPQVLLFNFGSNALDSVILVYSVNDEPEDSIFWTGNLLSLEFDTIELPEISLPPGNHSIAVYTTLPNGVPDSNPSNDSLDFDFVISTVPLQLTIILDNYPNETTWDVIDEDGRILFTGGPYGGFNSGDTVSYIFCMGSGCFDFTIYDSYGDGICCGYGEGSYLLINEETGEVLAEGGEFGHEETTEFCLDSPLSIFFVEVGEIECGEPSSGFAVVNAFGGEGIYTYSWSNGATDSIAAGLDEGYHFITVSDGTSEVSDSIFITDPNSYWYADEDGDGFGNPNDSIYACDPPPGFVDNNLDCDDTNPDINPGAEEICDGIDNNCDGVIDFGTGPVALCLDVTVFLNEFGEYLLEPEDINAGSYDSCGIDSMFVSREILDCSDLGSVELMLTVFDLAGRSDSCLAEVVVQDTLPPVAVCQTLEIEMDDPDSSVTVVPTAFDNGSIGNCVPLEFSIEGPEEVSCHSAGEYEVILTVEDPSGNSAQCTTLLIVNCESVLFSVSGQVATESGNLIEGAGLLINGDSILLTNSSGGYETTLYGGLNYSIEIFLDDMTVEGLSTIDLILIQRHILSIELLDSPYKIIASDVNMDGVISTFDLVLLQAFILGTIESLPQGISWLFIPSSYVFDQAGNPFDTGWPEVIELDYLSQNESDLDFTALKIGDAAGAAGYNGNRLHFENYPITVNLVKNTNNPEKHELVFSAGKDRGISGFQLELDIRASLEEGSVPILNSDLPGFGRDNFHFEKDEGVLRVNWWLAEPLEVNKGDKLFSISRIDDAQILSLEAGGRFQSEVYDEQLLPMRPVLDRSSDLSKENEVRLFQNRPNPFSRETVIPFYLPKVSEVEIILLDVDGRELRRDVIDGKSGMNYHSIYFSDWPAGVYFYKLISEEGLQSRSMIHQK
ncbi:MAG: T9SS C-terminal target domain-containing protein [Saprospirales bacterium]|nr:MAG: T9SS C-terminal target domain-containing protein [Saprospirales bacterium]